MSDDTPGSERKKRAGLKQKDLLPGPFYNFPLCANSIVNVNNKDTNNKKYQYVCMSITRRVCIK